LGSARASSPVKSRRWVQAIRVVRRADELQPHAVVLEVAEGQVAQPGVLVAADVVLDASAGAVLAFDLDGRAGLVGEDRLEPVPVDIGEVQLRAGCARSRLTITRETVGQLLRLRCSVISQTCPLRRSLPSWPNEQTQS